MHRLIRILGVVACLSIAKPVVAESLIEKLLRIAGLIASPAQMRGPGDEIDSGDIWVASPGSASPAPLTSDGDYRSPIFSPKDESLFALKGDDLVRIPARGGKGTVVSRAPGILKLVGFDTRNPRELVVLLAEGNSSPLGVLSLESGKVMPLPYDARSESERRMLAQIRGQERVYGDASVYLSTESKRGLSRTLEWTDVYLRRGHLPPQNVSTCDGVNCGQPALSADGRRVAFVKSDE